MGRNPLIELEAMGQSIWLDNLTREGIRGGGIARPREQAVHAGDDGAHGGGDDVRVDAGAEGAAGHAVERDLDDRERPGVRALRERALLVGPDPHGHAERVHGRVDGAAADPVAPDRASAQRELEHPPSL